MMTNFMLPDHKIQLASGGMGEQGVVGLMSFGGLVEEAYLTELRYPAAYAKYNEMRRRDPTIASINTAVNLFARTASHNVEPAGTTDADKRAAEFLEQCLDDMLTPLSDCIEDWLSAIMLGWSWSEINYKRRNGTNGKSKSAYTDGKIGWLEFSPRRQSTFYKWEFDDNGRVVGLWQSYFSDRKSIEVMVPLEKSLHFTAQRDMGNPEGIPLLEHVYEAWHFVKNLQIINGIGFERSFVGLPKFTYGTPENPYTPTTDDKTLVEKTGKGLRVDEKAFIAVPGQIGFELLTTQNANADSLLNTINHYRIQILQTALADFIALGTTSTGGSYALGADKSQLFLMAVDGWLDKVDRILNTYAVPRLFGYNTFDGITGYPQIKHTSVQKPDLAGLASYLQSLSNYIQPDALLEADLRSKAKLPERQADDDAETPEPNPNAEAEPESGEDEEDISAEMAEPHPPARGQKWFVNEWNRLRDEFHAAMKSNV